MALDEVFALGIAWVLDGLEVTIIGTIGSRLTEADTLHFSAGQVGAIASFYIAGAVIGAMVFGYFTDKLGRKKLFIITLGLRGSSNRSKRRWSGTKARCHRPPGPS